MSKEVLDQIYKLYVRLHLDYGHIIYHKYDPDKQLNFTEELEQAKYKAALAVSGAWKGTDTMSAKSSWNACTVLRISTPVLFPRH